MPAVLPALVLAAVVAHAVGVAVAAYGAAAAAVASSLHNETDGASLGTVATARIPAESLARQVVYYSNPFIQVTIVNGEKQPIRY